MCRRLFFEVVNGRGDPPVISLLILVLPLCADVVTGVHRQVYRRVYRHTYRHVHRPAYGHVRGHRMGVCVDMRVCIWPDMHTGMRAKIPAHTYLAQMSMHEAPRRSMHLSIRMSRRMSAYTSCPLYLAAA